MKQKRSKKGFTLMEVLVGIAVVAIISVPLLNMFATSFKVGRHSYDIDQANAVALDTIEKYRAGASALALESGEYNAVKYYDYNWGEATEDDYAFRVEAKVEGKPIGETPGADGDMQSAYLPQIIDNGGNSHTVTLKLPKLAAEATYAPTLTLTQSAAMFYLTSSGSLYLDGKIADLPGISIIKGKGDNTVFPVIVDNSNYQAGSVDIQVTGIPGVELALFVFGGGEEGNDSVSISVTGGAASITKLKRDVQSLDFDLLKISAKVIRMQDGVVLADHVTTSYVVR